MIPKTFAAAILLIALTVFCNSRLLAQEQQSNYAEMKTGILELVNKHRAGMGLAPLTMNVDIERAATRHNHNMATKKIPFGHDGFSARMKVITKQLKGGTGWAENVAMGSETAEEVVDLWLHSEGHKKNIEGDYNLTGIGIEKDANDDLYFTQIFV